MKTISLNGAWLLSSKAFENKIPAQVPGSVYQSLLEAELIPNPFYRDHEYEVREWMRHDYMIERSFEVNFKPEEHVELVCDGLDTLTNITINGGKIANTDNMHRRYRFDVTPFIRQGKNHIMVKFFSPIEAAEKREAACPYNFFQASDAVKGYIHLRKAHSMFGWDWGPQLPDAGIWRDISIQVVGAGRLDHVHIRQVHQSKEVVINLSTAYSKKSSLTIEHRLMSPDGELIEMKAGEHVQFVVKNPHYWWPVGIGEQPLYTLTTLLKNGQDTIDKKVNNIGLKTSQIKREKDQYGESFTYVHNNREVFLKGANYIIEDNLLGRTSYDRTKKLLIDTVKANHNAIRIWGGGIYPPDYFFDLCDELGLIVWQDFMFACSSYNLENTDWVKTVEEEIKDNLRRFHHHASLGLVCGNNENETAVVDWNIPEKEVSKRMYLELYESLIPTWIEDVGIDVPYWPSSPSSGGGFDHPNDDGRGDMHYWGVWHNNEPFTYYRNYFPRFMSEFGLQSFPALETVETFTKEEDRNIFSPVMESHQKNKTANEKIVHYISQLFRYPNGFDELLYVSQLIQAEGVRYGVEHFRRHYGRCMGSLYWQLNDCWPVASWSSIDYEGRWKALHYHSKKFYAPVLVSIEETADSAAIYLTNDTNDGISGTVTWSLAHLDGTIMQSQTIEYKALPQCAEKVTDITINLDKKEKRNVYLHVLFTSNGTVISDNLVLFAPDKHLDLQKPTINVDYIKVDQGVLVTLTTNTLTRFIELKLADYLFEDNYFHIVPNLRKEVLIETDQDLETVKRQLKIRSLIDTY